MSLEDTASRHVTKAHQPVIWAVSAYRLTDIFRSIAPEFSAQADIHIINKGFADAVEEIQARLRHERCDVIVAAGSNGAYLRQHLALPLVLVKVGGFDLLAALTRARQVSDRIAIVTHKTTAPELSQFIQLFDLPIQERAYETVDQARDCIRALAAQGIEVVVGPGLVANLADELGLHGVFLYAPDSARQAFSDAVEIARIKHVEASRHAQLDAVLRHLSDGVVAIDMMQKVLSVNPAMLRLAGSPETPMAQWLGRPLREVLPAVRAGSVLTRGWPDLGSVEQVGHRTLVINRVPVFEQGVQTGAVLTVIDSGDVEQVTSRLRLHQQIKTRHARYHLHQVAAVSMRMKQLITLCETYARRSDATVLISGESGTGKELIAQGIHNASRRAAEPFLAINCGAFTESLLESELFGYEDGAFTGARRGGKAGLFESAHLGTIFLDEIGEMPLVLQTRLLRVLQEKEVMRVGGRESIPVDVRVIAATHRDLLAMVGAQQFRQDLFYRLNILQVVIPPLRQRPEDLALLAVTLFDAAFKRAGLQDEAHDIIKAVLPLFMSHSWPGNVRELENAAERLAIGCIALHGVPSPDDLQRLLPELYGPRLVDGGPRPPATTVFGATELKAVTRQTEKAHLQTVLSECAGNQAEAAQRLGISRATLWRKLRA